MQVIHSNFGDVTSHPWITPSIPSSNFTSHTLTSVIKSRRWLLFIASLTKFTLRLDDYLHKQYKKRYQNSQIWSHVYMLLLNA